jgi:hypothetical protein
VLRGQIADDGTTALKLIWVDRSLVFIGDVGRASSNDAVLNPVWHDRGPNPGVCATVPCPIAGGDAAVSSMILAPLGCIMRSDRYRLLGELPGMLLCDGVLAVFLLLGTATVVIDRFRSRRHNSLPGPID